MATETKTTKYDEMRLAGASKGVALTTTLALTSLPFGTKYVRLSPRNFSTAVVARFLFNPWLTVLKADTGAASILDISNEAQDGDTTIINFSDFDTVANGDALYIGSHRPFRGVAVDIGTATQSTATTLAVEYLNLNGLWVSITPTDGTASGGATFAVDGNVTWTIPAAWKRMQLGPVIGSTSAHAFYTDKLYWTRWSTNTAFDSTVDVLQFRALNRVTTYAELAPGEWFDQLVTVGYGGDASVEALTDAGTANLVINCATMGEEFV